MNPLPLRYLSAADVVRALPMRHAIAAMREAFAQLARGGVSLPPRLQLDASGKAGTALIMPCYSASQQLFSLKLATVFPDNHQRGLPLIQSTVILTDGTTGTPLALMDGASLTAIRTGAASGLATDLLARPGATTAAIIGTGVQARTQLEAICCVRPITSARVYGRHAGTTQRFAAEMSQQLGIPVLPAASPAAALRGAGIICTATPSASPVFADADLSPGAHINAVGSFRPDMIEIPAATICRARVVVDHYESVLAEAGDLLSPLRDGLIPPAHFRTELGDLVLGRQQGRGPSDDITLFKSVGIAIQDLCAAAAALDNARLRNAGTPLPSASS